MVPRIDTATVARAGVSRRQLLKRAAAVVVLAAAGGGYGPGASAATTTTREKTEMKGRIKQSVSRWCFGKIPAADFYRACVEMGIVGIDLVKPEEWPLLKQYNLVGTCTPSHSLTKGLNHRENHATCLAQIRDAVEKTAAAGYPNVVCFSGNREGISDAEGAANCVEALKQVAGLAESRGVTLLIELLNSKVDHKDYQADRTAWAVDICKQVGSPRVKLLYDIYHMQIMEGDLIRTIKANIEYLGHFHTGGNPGRNEIDAGQEINYPAVMRAIAATPYAGYVAHEFVPTRDPLTSLREAVALCDV